jgi:type VII secretion protein EccB
MQSALVRKDAVMLHDPMRTHTRAITVGVIMSCLGLVGFVVFGLIKPSPSAPNQGIVISRESGAVYVATNNPRQLVPVLNLASARLMLMSQSSSPGGAGSTASSEGGPAGGTPTVVDDSALQGIPRGRLAGIPGAPLLLPEKPDQRVSPNWAVCDQLDVQSAAPDAAGRANVQTTVLGGVPTLAGLRPLGPKDAVLAAAPDGKTYLIYPTPPGSKSGASAVRARVDLNDAAVTSNFNLRQAVPRKMTAAELNAIPEVRRLAVPDVDGQGGQPKGYNVGIAAKIGTVVQAQVAGEDPHYYLVLKDALQQVSPAVAQLFQAANASNQQVIPIITAGQEAAAPRTQSLPVGDFPAERPNVVSASDAPVSCLSWSLKDGDEHTEVLLGSQVPVPPNMQPVQLNQPGAGGELVKWFYLPPGHAAVVRSASSKAGFASGPLYLVADTGARFGIPDAATATALGVNTNNGAFDPAPDAILRLLPSGPSLNHDDALRTFDTVPVDNRAGTWPTPTSNRSTGGS